ncbi:glycosyltransferase [Flammeovirga sp. MY04]|uniref:glycosyltransferase n=1 Tax=Flammeovirga sp. MY04 TaxID=1191459 RepID=UPI0008260C90|nr:glycosyltransferase [Flammeovirga sp. MY04]
MVTIYSILLILLIFSWKKLPLFPLTEDIIFKEGPSISIVVAFRNEEMNIKQLVESLIKQSYTNYNIILVNDHSEDQSLALIPHHPLIKTISLPNDLTGKKQAIRYGIEQSDSQLILTTDADCVHHKDWVTSFANTYLSRNAKMISGPVRFSYQNFWEKCMNAEFGSLILTGAASIGIKKPNMCNAANLCFERDAFIHQNDYEQHAHIPTGDDEFFLHQIAKENASDILFLKDKKAIVTSTPPKNLKEFTQQRIRWASKWKHYKNKAPLLGSLFVFFFHLSFFLTLIDVVTTNDGYLLFSLTLFVKTIVETWYNHYILKWFDDDKNIVLLPIISLFYPFYAVSIGFLSTFGNYKWKNRKIVGK